MRMILSLMLLALASIGLVANPIAASAQDATAIQAKNIATRAATSAQKLASLRQVKGPIVANAIGDSLSNMNSDASANLQGGLAYWNELIWLSGARIVVRRQAGIPGNVSTQIAVRLQDEVLNYSGVDVVFLMECTNDNNQGIANSICFANDVAAIRAINARGILPILLAIPPSVNTGPNSLVINAQKKVIAAAEGAMFIDPWATMRAADGTWLNAGDTTDGTHPSDQGAKKAALGILADPDFAALLPRFSASSNVIDGDQSNPIPSADFANTQAVGTGVLPRNWAFYGSTTGYATSVGVDPVSNRRLVTFTSSATSSGQGVFDSIPFDLSMYAGKRVRFTGRIVISGLQGKTGAEVSARLIGSDAVEGSAFIVQPFNQFRVDGDGTFSGEAQVPPSSSSAIVRMTITGTGPFTVKAGEFAVRSVPTAVGLIDTRSTRIADRVRTITASYTMTVDDRYVMCDATAGPVAITLPSAGIALYGNGNYAMGYYRPVPAQGLQYEIYKVDSSANSCTVSPPASTSVSGSTAAFSLTSQYAPYRVLAARTGLFLRVQ